MIAWGRGCVSEELNTLGPGWERPTIGFDGEDAAPSRSTPMYLATGKLGSGSLFGLGGGVQPVKRTISALATDGPSCSGHTKETVYGRLP